MVGMEMEMEMEMEMNNSSPGNATLKTRTTNNGEKKNHN